MDISCQKGYWFNSTISTVQLLSVYRTQYGILYQHTLAQLNHTDSNTQVALTCSTKPMNVYSAST